MKGSFRALTSTAAEFVPRRTFPEHNVEMANFVGHHRRALADLKGMSREIDFILELRDSRAPISSINPLFDQVLPGTPKFILYTKRDVSLLRTSQLAPVHPDGMYQLIDVNERKYANRIVAQLKKLAAAQHPKPPLGFRVLITGFPNSGKSSLINKMREAVFGKYHKKVARTGSQAGVTRKVSESILISKEPKIYLYDTPGVAVPQAYNWEHAIKLALIGAIPFGRLDPILLADYLLYQMNQFYPLGGRYPGPMSNDIHQVLWSLAHNKRAKPKRETWDEKNIAAQWVNRFAMGGIGKIQLDDLSTLALQEILPKLQDQKIDLSELPAPKYSISHNMS